MPEYAFIFFLLLPFLPLLLPPAATAKTFYLKTQFEKNDGIVEKDLLNCSLNGIDLTELGLERNCEQWPELGTDYLSGTPGMACPGRGMGTPGMACFVSGNRGRRGLHLWVGESGRRGCHVRVGEWGRRGWHASCRGIGDAGDCISGSGNRVAGDVMSGSGNGDAGDGMLRVGAVNYWGARMLYLRDSKHFVDRPLLNEPKKVVEQFKARFNVTEWKQFIVSDMSPAQVDELGKFVQENFGKADGLLIPHEPEDWKENPQKFDQIKDAKLKNWANEMHKMWKEMSKKMASIMDSKGNQQKHSMLYVSNPFVVPGGRFRELRYWDSYWIVRGLLASGMTSTVRNICKNFAELIDRFGFVPAGNRIFYSKRSQPPFLTLMVYDYFGATGDVKFLKEMLPTLEKEFDFWRTKRSVEVIVKGKKKTFYQYKADTNMPRPEAFCQDVDLVKNMSDPKEKAKVWRNIASASESGWDFSSRWIQKDEADTANAWKLTNLMTTRIVPMDLNALMCGNMEMLAHLYLQIGDKAKSRAYHGKYQLFMEDFKSLFYKKEHGIWYDYNMDSGTLNEAYYGSAAMPLFVRCYDTIDLGTAERMFQRLEQFDKQHKLVGHPFGVPVSITVNSSQQWDFPNIFPPSQHMLIEGLRRSSNKKMEEKATEMAQKWVSANYNRFQNCLRQMWDKMTADTGTPGSGGEYNAQTGFGWTNGAMLDLLVTYGDVLKLKSLPEIDCRLKNLVQEPEQYPNNVSEYRAQRFMEEQKEVDEINRSQNYWMAVVYERFALMTDEELRQLTGSIIRNRTRKPKTQFKQAVAPIDYGDLPETFDARQKWPECADLIGTTTDQDGCGSCWAVSAAATFTARICVARLKKGIITDSKDPRAYVSAQYTMECAPETNRCKGGDDADAWVLYHKNGSVSGTDNDMLSGCKPYIIQSMSETEKEEKSCVKTCNAQWLEKQFGKEKVPYEPFLVENLHMPKSKEPVHWWDNEDPDREPAMMREIMENGAIQAGYMVYSDFYKCGQEGIYTRGAHTNSENGSGHGVKIIGWGEAEKDNQSVKYWLVVNSWGLAWGDQGLFKIRRGTDEAFIESRGINFGKPDI
uniref:Trehalase n=1 Tax=Globodera rostochiensis TaxID=31243 RepID=A0A914GVW3_GLORO